MEPEIAMTDGYSAWISIDNVKLPQYGREVTTTATGTKEVTCFIASEVDKKFAVNWSLPASQEPMSGWVYIDGKDTGWKRKSKPNTGPIILTKSYERISPTSVRPFMFSRRELTDDDTHLDENVEHLGDITLNIWVVRLFPEEVRRKYLNSGPFSKTHERSKKATIAHQAALGEEYTKPESRPKRAKRVRLAISFIFKYRPRDLLQAEGIIPPGSRPDIKLCKQVASESIQSAKRAKPKDDHEEHLEHRKRLLEIRKREPRARKEELEEPESHYSEQSHLDLTKTKRQKMNTKPEPRPPVKLRLDADIIDLT